MSKDKIRQKIRVVEIDLIEEKDGGWYIDPCFFGPASKKEIKDILKKTIKIVDKFELKPED